METVFPETLMIRRQKWIVGLLAVVLLIIGVMLFFSHKPTHYEVRKDLSIYFQNADDVIVSVREALRRHDRKITISYQSHGNNMEDIGALVRDLMQYAMDETNNPTEGDYIYQQYGGYDLNYHYTEKNGIYCYTLEITPNYYTTLEQEAQVSEKLKEVLESFHFTRYTSDYEKVRTIYDYVYSHVSYDEIHKKNANYRPKLTAYGALIYQRAVCQGYAVLMYRMLRESGITARVITGKAWSDKGEEVHAWNLVCIEGLYYNLDVTWDKQTESEKYFLKSDDGFEGHERDPEFRTDNFYQAYPMAEWDYPASTEILD